MTAKRKTEDEFQIHGHYAHGWEEVTCETTRAAALATLKTYRANEPGTAFKLVKKRVPKAPLVACLDRGDRGDFGTGAPGDEG